MNNTGNDSDRQHDSGADDGLSANAVADTYSEATLSAAGLLRGRQASAQIGTTGPGAENQSFDDDDPDDNVDDDGEPPLFPSGQPGHFIMQRSDITAALRNSGYDGSYDALSGGEETRARTLVALQRSDLWRPHVIGTPAMLARLDELQREQNNFAAVIGLVRDAVTLSLVARTALQIPPILVVGSPGIGKSRFARGLARCLDTDLNTINGSTIPDVGSITGYPPVWRSAAQGRLSKFVISAKTTSPLVFCDECEKIEDYEQMRNPLDRLLTLLEPSTAIAFQDENLQVALRTDHVIYLFACNSLANLSAPFLDRVVAIRVADLHRDQLDGVFETMLGEVTARLGLAVSFANRTALQPLHSLGLRRARMALGIAVAHAVADDRRFVTRADLTAAVSMLERPDEARHPVGFVPPAQSGGQRVTAAEPRKRPAKTERMTRTQGVNAIEGPPPMKSKTNHTKPELSPSLIEAYSNYPAVEIDHSIRMLPSFLAHAALFEALGAPDMAAAAQRAWWYDAVILAAEAAASAEQARAKIAALEPALDGRGWLIANDGLRTLSAMITVAVEHERHRWDLEASTRH